MTLDPTFWAVAAGVVAWLAIRDSRIGFSAIFLAALAAASTPRGTDPNEVAGTLAPVVPVLFALAASTRRSGPRFAGLLLGLAGLGRLLATGSRGGILAVGVGLAVLVALEGRRARLGLGILGAGALVAGTWFAIHQPLGGWSFGGWISGDSAKGWTLENLLTGRPEIWRRAIWIVEDLPALGIGPGRFDEVVAAAYPFGPHGAPAPADAHQFLLQLAVDLGVPGAFLVVVFVGLAIARLAYALRLASSTSDRASRRSLAGVAGGLAAWLSFGLADAVALGTPGALVGAGLVGLAFGSAPAGPPAKRSKLARLAIALTLLVALLPRDLENRRDLREIVAHPAGEAASAEQRFVTLEPERLDLLVALSPTDVALARRAVLRWPTRARAWSWLGDALRDHDGADDALDAYLRAAALDPRDGHVWLSIGQLRESDGRLLAALDAYETACRRGDPGANACGAGGRLAESLGQVDRARSLYLRSRWPPFRSRAESLDR